ncbi:Dabb family protein [Paenibacillus xerothermodurans]|uniref:Dabb family protein n=1 Tax=Paenibacillus xerothermodurans TaxID=1977292 RepID=A0A2W1NQZ2_PAEXE|nr:Dabb family protein [Paenibacillus xerothermodurans]PZE20156.1 Dabb family protein [Paenibacillus xerothermodurans]
MEVYAFKTTTKVEEFNMVEHLVFFKLHESTSEQDKQHIISTLHKLKEIPGITEFSAGLNHSAEGKSKGFEVGMRIGFQDRAALDSYLPHLLHTSTIDGIRHHFADVFVFDYTWGA